MLSERILKGLVALTLLAVSVFGKRTVIITGANSGVGLAATKILAATNEWNVVMACRNPTKALQARQTIVDGKENTEVLPLDLADTDSIKKFASIWGERDLDVLACNAGIQESTSGFGGKEAGNLAKRTKQGFEITVGTNHIGHFLLQRLLIGRLNKSKRGRIVIVGSGVHDPESPGGNVGSKATLGKLQGLAGGFLEPISMVDDSTYDPDKAYKDSKLCNVMLAIEWARRLKAQKSKVTCNSMNPGLIPTTGLFASINPVFVFFFTILTRYVFRVAVSEEEGGKCLATMIASQTYNDLSGGYFSATPGPNGSPFGPAIASKEAKDEENGQKLWDLTEKLLAKV
jgi:protochlorophyllide reductase